VIVAVCSTNDTHEARSTVAKLLLRATPPDAIASMSDELALGALRAATDAGIDMPAALAVSGWDDGADARDHDLTTVRQSLRTQGSQSILVALGDEASDASDAWSVVVRGSTRASSS